MRVVRVFMSVAIAGAALFVLPATPSGAGEAKQSAKTTKWCRSFATLQDEIGSIDVGTGAGASQQAARELAKAFRKSAKQAPKDVKKAMTTIASMYDVLGGRGGTRDAANMARNSAKLSESFGSLSSFYATSCQGSGSAAAAGGSGSGARGGSLTLDGATYEFASARCYLQPQPSAGGGGTIELTGQGEGTTPDGERVFLDFTRFDEESMFEGDDITVEIGPLGSSTDWSARLDNGTVQRSGSQLSVSDVEFSNFEDGTSVTGSFVLNC